MSKKLAIRSSTAEFLIFTAQSGGDIEVRYHDDTVWLTQKMMAELFATSVDNINLHIKNIYLSEELLESATSEDSSVVQKEGSREVKRKVKFYNLDMIIAAASMSLILLTSASK